MDRNLEYHNYLTRLDNAPPMLDHVVSLAQTRARKMRRNRRFLTVPVSSIAAAFLVFVVMVNLSPTFAYAMGQIPILRELADAVSLSPSLSKAVENDYAQVIGLEQTDNGVTMRVEYVIVDQRQLNIFYTLRSQEYSDMYGFPEILTLDGEEFEGYAIGTGGFTPDNIELRQFVVDFFDYNMPNGLILECIVNGERGSDKVEPLRAADELHEMSSPPVIAVFSFTLNFDPEFTQQGRILTLDQDIVLDGQSLTVTTVEIYPTHMKVNLTADEKNAAWLISLKFYFIDDKGVRFDQPSNGTFSFGSVDSPMMESYLLDSAFFFESHNFTMFITGAEWLSKEMEQCRIDLAKGTSDRLPEGVELRQVVRSGNSWELTFSSIERERDVSYQLFDWYYFDENGDEHFGYSNYGEVPEYDETRREYVTTPGFFTTRIVLWDYPHDVVYLKPLFSHTTELATPLEVIVR
ncbi:MAG: DUF4179 domain-containing protein [Coriobacteriia bacterium]|nr:DUF4179 domain-containing protein [Coriobacteriia bacterium]